MNIRMDKGSIGEVVARVDLNTKALERPRKLIDGSTIAQGAAARTGDHRYPWGIEKRSLDELRSIVEQLPGTLVTVGHPEKLLRYGGRMPIGGRVSRASLKDSHAIVDIRLNFDGQNALESGRTELSLGYETKVDDNKFQTLTRVDHLAMVHSSRCGASCAVRIDCDGDFACGCVDASREDEKRSVPLEIQIINQLGAMCSGG